MIRPAAGDPDRGSVTSFRVLLELYAGRLLPEWEVLEATRVQHTIPVGDDLFATRAGQDCLFLVRHGILAVQVRPTGQERVVVDFMQEGELIGYALRDVLPTGIRNLVDSGIMPRLNSLRPLGAGEWQLRATALERTEVVGYDRSTMEGLAERHVAWARAISRIVHLNGLVAFAHLVDQRTRSVEERYADLLQHQPRLVGRVRQKDLARFLGVSESALSRIVHRRQPDR